MLDLTINLSAIIQTLVVLVGGIWFVWEMRTRLVVLTNSYEVLDERLSKIDTQLEILAKTTIELARQDERMNAQDMRIQELSNRLDASNRIYDLGREVDRKTRIRPK